MVKFINPQEVNQRAIKVEPVIHKIIKILENERNFTFEDIEFTLLLVASAFKSYYYEIPQTKTKRR